MFSLDHESLPVPFLASHRRKAFGHMQRIGYGFGPRLEVPTLDCDVRIQWLRSRWPRLTSETEGWKLEQQWGVREGVVIAHTRLHNKTSCDFISTTLAKNLDFCIRELDFVSRDCPFNEDDNNDQRYAEGAGPGGYGFVKIHEFPSRNLGAYRHKTIPTETDNAEQSCHPDGVAAVVGFFVDGEPWTIDRIETEDIRIKPKGYTDLVVGYRLALITKKADNRALLTLTANDLDINGYLSETIWEGVGLPNDFPLGKRPLSRFFVERNVENILSVGMVPLCDDYIWDYEAARKGREGRDKDQILALTCGDLSGHRICLSASYFAFKFLVEVAEKIPKNHGLRNRIRNACLGHLRWILLRAEVREGKYARNYWISGKIMPPSIWLFNDGPTDTTFQILKAYEFYRVFDQTDDGSDVINLLTEAESGEGFAAVKWLQQLEKEDARNGCVWRHGRRGGIDYYRLDDQAWIWGSLTALSTILKWNAETRKGDINRSVRRTYSQNGQMGYNHEETTRLRRKYDPERVRQEIFSRFPATNPNINGGKMFAVTRSPHESRFEFHSRDTALFYRLGGQMFLDDMNAPWERTLNAQKSFPSKRDTETDSLLRYGLSLLMAVKGFSTSALHQPAEVLEEAQKFVSNCILTNGLFANDINGSGGLDSHVYYRDYNLHVPFEMLVWISWNEVLDTLTEDLNNIYEMIKEWRAREENRRGNQPRWTKKHEIKYREAVQRSLLLGESAVRDFKVCQTRVASLRKSVTSHREITTAIYNQQMDDRSFRQNDNIKYFTYSTVFFLPLSFATSFFSMQAKPTVDLIRQMVVCTVVAFVILLVILFTLPATLKRLRDASESVWTFSKSAHKWTGLPTVPRRLRPAITRYTGRLEDNRNSPNENDRVSDEESGRMSPASEKSDNSPN
ncbi:hypothetical protein ABHI18_000805 [Aspergillus niger]